MKKSKEERLKAREEYKKRSDRFWNYLKEQYEKDESIITKTIGDIVWEMLKDDPNQSEEFAEYVDFLDINMLVFNCIGSVI